MKVIKSKNIKWWVGTMACVLLFSIIGIFSYEKMCFILNGVKIEATLEKRENSSLATIKGNALRATFITLNGREIFIDKQGNFSEIISILPGFSVVTLNARDKFGKIAERRFELVEKDNAPAIAFEGSEVINIR